MCNHSTVGSTIILEFYYVITETYSVHILLSVSPYPLLSPVYDNSAMYKVRTLMLAKAVKLGTV